MRLKNGRARGQDGIVAELLKMINERTMIIQDIWETENCKCAVMHSLHKKASRTNVNNCREYPYYHKQDPIILPTKIATVSTRKQDRRMQSRLHTGRILCLTVTQSDIPEVPSDENKETVWSIVASRSCVQIIIDPITLRERS